MKPAIAVVVLMLLPALSGLVSAVKVSEETANGFTVNWYMVKDGLLSKTYDIEVVNNQNKNRKINVEFVLDSLSIDVDALYSVNFYELKTETAIRTYSAASSYDIGQTENGDNFAENHVWENVTENYTYEYWKPITPEGTNINASQKSRKDNHGEKDIDKYTMVPSFGRRWFRLEYTLGMPQANANWGTVGRAAVDLKENDSADVYEYHPWWNDNYLYRKPITVAIGDNGMPDNYTLFMVIDNSENLENKTLAWPHDVRFLENENEGELSFWIDAGGNDAYGRENFWIMRNDNSAKTTNDFLLNAGFETGDLTNWKENGTAGTSIVNSDNRYSGTYSVRIDNLTSAYSGRQLQSDNYGTVSPGDNITFGARYMAAPDGASPNVNDINIRISLEYLDASGNILAVTNNGGFKPANFSKWNLFTNSDVVPVGASKVALLIEANESVNNDYDIYFDDAFIRFAWDNVIWMYYGFAGATTASDENSTFLLYDDFNGDNIDSSKWNTYGSDTMTVIDANGDGVLSVNSSGGDWTLNGATSQILIGDTENTGYELMFSMRENWAGAGGQFMIGYSTGKLNISQGINFYWLSSTTSWKDNGTGAATAGGFDDPQIGAGGSSFEKYGILRQIIKQGSIGASFYDHNDNLFLDDPIYSGNPWQDDDYGNYSFMISNATGPAGTRQIYIDNARIRKFVTQEPVMSIGAEESLPVTQDFLLVEGWDGTITASANWFIDEGWGATITTTADWFLVEAWAATAKALNPTLITIAADNTMIDNHRNVSTSGAVTATTITVLVEDNDGVDTLNSAYFTLYDNQNAVIDNENVWDNRVLLDANNFAFYLIYDAEDNELSDLQLGFWDAGFEVYDNDGTAWDNTTENVFYVDEMTITLSLAPSNADLGFAYGFGVTATGTVSRVSNSDISINSISLRDENEGLFAVTPDNSYSFEYIITSRPSTGGVEVGAWSLSENYLDSENVTSSYDVNDNRLYNVFVWFEENYDLVPFDDLENNSYDLIFLADNYSYENAMSSNPDNFVVNFSPLKVRLTVNDNYWRTVLVAPFGDNVNIYIVDTGTLLQQYEFVLTDYTATLGADDNGLMYIRKQTENGLINIHQDYWNADGTLTAFLIYGGEYSVLLTTPETSRSYGWLTADSIQLKEITVVSVDVADAQFVWENVAYTVMWTSDNFLRVVYQDNLNNTNSVIVDVYDNAGVLVHTENFFTSDFVMTWNGATPSQSYSVKLTIDHAVKGSAIAEMVSLGSVWTVPFQSRDVGTPFGAMPFTLGALFAGFLVVVFALTFGSYNAGFTVIGIGIISFVLSSIFGWFIFGWPLSAAIIFFGFIMLITRRKVR